MDVWSTAYGWGRSKCLLWVSLHPVNVTDVKDIWLLCIAALKQNRCGFTGHQWQIDCQKLPLSFTIIILRNRCSRFMPSDRYMRWPVCVCVYETEKMKKDDTKKRWNGRVCERDVIQETVQSCSLSLEPCVSVCGFVCVCRIQWPCSCLSVSKQSHTVHNAPGLYPSNCRSQSDIVLLWPLSMVLHISPEMTKSLSQCSWPPASLLVLLHSHSLMWPWIGIGHQPHSGIDTASAAHVPKGLQSLVFSWYLSDSLSVFLVFSLGGIVSAMTLRKRKEKLPYSVNV